VASASRVAYEDVLSILARGSTSDAAMALVTFERDVDADPQSGTSEAVEKAEMSVLSDLAQRDPEALLPALLLHIQLFRVHAPQRRYAAAGRHLELAERTASLYAAATHAPEGQQVAAEALTVLGSDLMISGHRSDARRVLAAALDLLPDLPEALLLLGSDRERDGAYEEAVDYLRRLNELRPDWLEGRARLAVNLGRAGFTDEAAERFRDLCQDPAADWAAILGCEELARLHLKADAPGRAQKVLAEAIERFPESERLRLAYAYAVDRSGQPTRARSLIEKISERPTGGDETPRRRYNRGTGGELILALSAHVESLASQRADALQAALTALSEDEEAAADEEDPS
jgi:tetratricopeptide (TPR) repeat protein